MKVKEAQVSICVCMQSYQLSIMCFGRDPIANWEPMADLRLHRGLLLISTHHPLTRAKYGPNMGM